MGFALSWLGVRGKSRESVLEELAFRLTGEQEDIPESPAVCAQVNTGWFVLVLNNSMDAFDDTLDIASLSKGAEVVTCMVEEHVMMSGYASWKDGTRTAIVIHDGGQQGVRHLEVENLPAELADIVEKAMAAQDEEDRGKADTDFIFDIPIDAAQRRTGFRHDRADLDGVVSGYDILERLPRNAAHGGGWLRGIFGRGR